MAEPLQLPIEQLRFNPDGLIPAIAQDWLDGAVLGRASSHEERRG